MSSLSPITMPNFIGSLEKTETTIDIFVSVAASSYGAAGVIFAPEQNRWSIAKLTDVHAIQSWLADHAPRDKQGRKQVYGWLPGMTTYDNIPLDEFDEYSKGFAALEGKQEDHR